MDNSNETVSQKLYNFNNYDDDDSYEEMYINVLDYYQNKEIQQIDDFINTLKGIKDKLHNISVEMDEYTNNITTDLKKYDDDLDKKSKDYDRFKLRLHKK